MHVCVYMRMCTYVYTHTHKERDLSGVQVVPYNWRFLLGVWASGVHTEDDGAKTWDTLHGSKGRHIKSVAQKLC